MDFIGTIKHGDTMKHFHFLLFAALIPQIFAFAWGYSMFTLDLKLWQKVLMGLVGLWIVAGYFVGWHCYFRLKEPAVEDEHIEQAEQH